MISQYYFFTGLNNPGFNTEDAKISNQLYSCPVTVLLRLWLWSERISFLAVAYNMRFCWPVLLRVPVLIRLCLWSEHIYYITVFYDVRFSCPVLSCVPALYCSDCGYGLNTSLITQYFTMFGEKISEYVSFLCMGF